ncbi:MAG: caspase family protein [Bacteroidota bacterium]
MRSPIKFLQTILILILVLGGTALGQSDWDATEYYGVPERDKSVVFLDEFEDNRNQWDLGSLYLSERIHNGEFYIASHASHTYTKRRPIPMDLASDFEIEAKIRFVKGMSGKQAGLNFGRDVRGNEFSVAFNSNLQYRISKSENGRSYDIMGWQGTSNLRHKHAYNSLMVRQLRGKWYFFINRELVAEMAAQPLYGDEVGFSLGGHMAIEVDFLRISEIKSIDAQGPKLTMLAPNVSDGETIMLKDRRQILEGQVFDASGITSLTINGYDVSFSKTGYFRASLMLPNGASQDIKIEVSDRFNNVTTQSFVLKHEVPMAAQAPLQLARPPIQVNPEGRPAIGNNYLLLIGVNEYENWNPLHNAVKDCQDLASTLIQFYWFEPDKVISLYNHQATRENILETLEGLQEMIRPEDNLLIYYAGHGYYDELSGLGYWVPVDARLNKIPDFIRNSTIHDYLRTIDSKNTFLIADACYAGSLFAAYRGSVNENARSRWAFTSGDIEKVWDGQPGQNSPFARYLIRFLRENSSPKLPANILIEEVGSLVQRNTAQTPQGSPLRLAGDDGGIFVFYRR